MGNPTLHVPNHGRRYERDILLFYGRPTRSRFGSTLGGNFLFLIGAIYQRPNTGGLGTGTFLFYDRGPALTGARA